MATSVGSKGINKAASSIKTDLDNLYDEINVQVSGLVDGIEPNSSGTGSNSQTVHHQYNKTMLRSRKKNEGNLSGGKVMFSRVVKQGLLAFGRENDGAQCSGLEKNALPVFLVGIKFLHQLRFRKGDQMNMVGTKSVTSK